jgi:hypothetical protein
MGGRRQEMDGRGLRNFCTEHRAARAIRHGIRAGEIRHKKNGTRFMKDQRSQADADDREQRSDDTLRASRVDARPSAGERPSSVEEAVGARPHALRKGVAGHQIRLSPTIGLQYLTK